MKQWTRIAIVGMGALGMMYGERIAETLGSETVCFVADEERSRRYQQMDFVINGIKIFYRLQCKGDETGRFGDCGRKGDRAFGSAGCDGAVCGFGDDNHFRAQWN